MLDLRNKAFTHFMYNIDDYGSLMKEMCTKNEELKKINPRLSEFQSKKINTINSFYISVTKIIDQFEHHKKLLKLESELIKFNRLLKFNTPNNFDRKMIDLRNKTYKNFLILGSEVSAVIANMDAKNEELRKTNPKVAEYNDKKIDTLIRFYNASQDLVVEIEHNTILMKLQIELAEETIEYQVPDKNELKESLFYLTSKLKETNGKNKQT